MHSLQKHPPKDRSLGPWPMPQYLVRDVIGLVEPLRRQVPALREAVCSLPDKGTAGPTCHRLRSAPSVAMVQATDLRDLYDLSRLGLARPEGWERPWLKRGGFSNPDSNRNNLSGFVADALHSPLGQFPVPLFSLGKSVAFPIRTNLDMKLQSGALPEQPRPYWAPLW